MREREERRERGERDMYDIILGGSYFSCTYMLFV